MAKPISQYICQQCGYAQIGWAGRCPECGIWGSLVETMTGSGKRDSKGSALRLAIDSKEPIALSAVPVKKTARIKTQIAELDRVLGGGLVSGQVVLIAGEPGIGKSTLLLQVANQLSVDGSQLPDSGKTADKTVKQSGKAGSGYAGKTGKPQRENQEEKTGNSGVLYASGEESVYQIKLRAERLKIKNHEITLLEETDVDILIERVVNVASQGKTPGLLVVDSVQTMSTTDLSGLAGSVGQVRECTYRLVRLAKNRNIPVVIVGHITKEGTVAGPAALMHIVDTVLWFEGDKSMTTRMLRAVKNRFGPTDEVGIFSMQDNGLVSVDNPEGLFLTNSSEKVAGNIVTSVLQGTRPVLFEVQALVVPTKMAFPRRVAQGIDAKRYELLLAVLTRRCGLPLNDYDCYANVAGGISLSRDPSADLAVCLATASAYFDKPLAKNTVAIGEVGLLGDIRPVMAQGKRVSEAKRLGYKNTITSENASLRQVINKLLK
jgi:DNA repair protein RadA/Sms